MKSYLLFLFVSLIAGTGYSQIPQYFLNPPNDSKIEIYGIAFAESEEVAFAYAISELANKIEMDVSGVTSSIANDAGTVEDLSTTTSKVVTNQKLFRFTVQGMEQSFVEESENGVVNSNYTSLVKLIYTDGIDSEYLIQAYKEILMVDDEEEEIASSGNSSWVNSSFSEIMEYVEDLDGMDYRTQKVEVNNETLWFTLVSVKIEAINQPNE